MVQCGNCLNFAHVPPELGWVADPRPVAVRGCAFVPIAEYPDWFAAHPCNTGKNAEELAAYGLWAYCAECSHAFDSKVLVLFPIAAHVSGLLYNAGSPETAAEMKALLEGHCPISSFHENLLALMTSPSSAWPGPEAGVNSPGRS
jgi:hypothetical protein